MTSQNENQTQVNYKALFEAAPGLYLILLPDSNFTITAVSNSYAAATMTVREQIIGKGLFEVFPDNPDDKFADGESNLRNSLNTVLKTKTAHTMAVQKYDIRNTDGTFQVRWWSVVNKPVPNAKGEVQYIIHSAEDVTQQIKDGELLKENDEKHKLLFDSIDEGFCIIEMIFDEQKKPVDYRFLEINAAFEKQSGLSNAIGKRMREFAPNHEEYWFETFGKIVLTGESIRFENHSEHLQRWYDVYAFRFGNPKNLQVAILFKDSTERRKAAEQLAAANKELEAFSYSVSHDLRAPLRAVNGFSDMLVQKYGESLDADAKRLLGIIRTNALNMGNLIDDLLAFSRTGRKEVSLAKTDMQSLAWSAVSELCQNEQEKMNTVTIKNLPHAHCDMQLMRQVWVNLISNALKYSSKKQKPEIEIEAQEKENETIFSIKDNGAGFDMQFADKLFGVFQRLHSQKEFEGNGVGLALVQRIIAKHGGRVWAESELDKGATFYFSLRK
jgi:PAS domain S-box-containing protein